MMFPTIMVEIEGFDALLRQSSMPTTALNQSALLAAQWVQALWINLAQRMDVRSSGAYIRGLQSSGSVRMVSERVTGDRLEIVINIIATAPHSSIVEEGHEAFHLPSRINWSATTGRVKRTKDGTPYMHIPLRHAAFATPAQAEEQGLTRATMRTMMPQEIYLMAKRLHYVRRLNVGPIYRHHATVGGQALNTQATARMHQNNAGMRHMAIYGASRMAPGQFQQADRYHWPKGKHGRLDRSHTTPSIIGGDSHAGIAAGGSGWRGGMEEHRGARLVGRDSGGAPLINPAWKFSKFHGLFKAGGKGHTQYMTIRTITATSPGWNIPAQTGRFIAARVAAEASTNAALREIVMEPLLAVLKGGA